MSQIPAWYGKLPSVGDFASRRWPEALVEPWDRWLADELGMLQHTLGEGWLQGYLDSPTWRFVLSATTLGSHQTRALAGVLMPSVDKVGRYFPLAIAAELDRMPGKAEEVESLMAWLHALDDLAADALQDDWGIDELERQLASCLPPGWPPSATSLHDALRPVLSGHARFMALPMAESRQALIGSLGHGLLNCVLSPASPEQALTWWWCEPDANPARRQMWLGRGLPRDADFTRLWASATP
ncbi:MAG TPA: type VI secretion system-associated protein TagF [Aquabacterium sp.]|nr:type VI secretion system-associated protein TagF [Aquabacterium sp.]